MTDKEVKINDNFEDFKSFIENSKNSNVAIFTHGTPDPDAIGSMMAMMWMFDKFGIKSTSFYAGSVSHPQNNAMVNLLDPSLVPVSEYDGEKFDKHILLDTIPSYAGLPEEKINFDIVIDHHKEPCSQDCIFINLKAGSCCATVYYLIKKMGLTFKEQVDIDSKVATAMLVGIATDTENLMSDDATEYELSAWKDLLEFKEPINLKKIVNFERPKFWVDSKAAAINNVIVTEGVGVVGMGVVPAKHRDMIADMSDEMLSWEDIHTAIAFAIVDGDRLEGSVRSSNASTSVPQLCKELGGKHGSGGGKLGKGAYSYNLSGGSIDEDDDQEVKEQIWQAYNTKESKRINRILKK